MQCYYFIIYFVFCMAPSTMYHVLLLLGSGMQCALCICNGNRQLGRRFIKCVCACNFRLSICCAPYVSTQQTRLTIRIVATIHVYNCIRIESYGLDLKRPRFSVVRMVRIGFTDISNVHFHVASRRRCANVGFYYGIHVYCISAFVLPCISRW